MRNTNVGPHSLATARGHPHPDVWSFCGSDRPPPMRVVFSTQRNPDTSEPLTVREVGTCSSSAGSLPSPAPLCGDLWHFFFPAPVDVAHSAPMCLDAKPDRRHSCRLPGGSQRLWSSRHAHPAVTWAGVIEPTDTHTAHTPALTSPLALLLLCPRNAHLPFPMAKQPVTSVLTSLIGTPHLRDAPVPEWRPSPLCPYGRPHAPASSALLPALPSSK